MSDAGIMDYRTVAIADLKDGGFYWAHPSAGPLQNGLFCVWVIKLDGVLVALQHGRKKPRPLEYFTRYQPVSML